MEREQFIKVMRHCTQCRADAIGFLDEDRSLEYLNSMQKLKLNTREGFCPVYE